MNDPIISLEFMFSFEYPPFYTIYNEVVVTPLRAYRHTMSQKNGWPCILRPGFIERMDVINNIDCILIRNDILFIGFRRPIDGMTFMIFETCVHLLCNV